MENHVTSKDLSERLKKLGVPQKSNFYWCLVSDQRGYVLYDMGRAKSMFRDEEMISAYLSSEMISHLPLKIECNGETQWLYISKHDEGYGVTYGSIDKNSFDIVLEQYHENFAKALGLMLEYLILNGFISVTDLK